MNKHTTHTRNMTLTIVEGILILIMLICLGIGLNAQGSSYSFGNTFIHSDGSLTVFDNHVFDNSLAGTQPGLVGGEREPALGIFNFAPDAGWENAQNEKHVDGYVRFCGNKEFLFPIGDNNKYRPAAVSKGTFVEAAYFGVNPTTAITSDIRGGNFPILPGGGPFNSNTMETNVVTKVSEYEYWDINGIDEDTKITLTWDEDSNVDIITSYALANLTIVGWDADGGINGTGQWVKIPSAIDPQSISQANHLAQFNGPAGNFSAGSITTTGTLKPSDYEIYTLGAGCNNMTVDISPDTTICLGDQILLTATSWEGVNWSWNTGDNTAQILVSPTVLDTFIATAIFGDCVATNNVKVQVSSTAVELGENISICKGEEVTIHAYSEPGNQYQWSTGQFGGEEITISPNGSITVTVTVTNAFGCTATDNVYVEVFDKPDVFTGRDRAMCLGDSVFVQAFGSLSGYGYLWSTGDTTATVMVSPTEDTTYEVYLTENGCSDTSYVSVEILPTAFVEILGDTIICPGESVTLTANGSGTDFEWNTGQTGSIISVTPLSSGYYSVTMTNDELCEAITEIYVSLYDASLVDFNDVVNICPGESVTFEATGIFDYIQWSDGSTGPTYTVSPNVTTNYSATTYFNSCSAVTPLVVNVVNDLYFELGNDITICSGESVTINLDSLSGTFLWSTGATTPSITVSPSVNTNYSVTVTSGTCVADDNINIIIGTTGCSLDLYVLKSVNDATPQIGEIVTFEIEIGNTSGLVATGVTVQDILQSGFGYVSDIPSQGIYTSSTGIWDIGILNPGQTVYLYIDAEVLGNGVYTNTASLLNVDQDDSNPNNNEETVVITPSASGQIGDYVWRDSDGNGIQDSTEQGIEGIDVSLYEFPNGGLPIINLVTGPNGEFCFTELEDGDYYVKFGVPDTMKVTIPMVSNTDPEVDPGEDSDVTDANGLHTTGIITIVNGSSIKTCDAGLYKLSSIGNIVWMDDNDNGVASRYEVGIDSLLSDVKLTLFNATNNEELDFTYSYNGYYLFDNLEPGTYYLEISEIPLGHHLVTNDVGPDDTDSDFYLPDQEIKNFGRTAIITLGIEEDNIDIDGGVDPEQNVAIELYDFWGERMFDEEFNRIFWITESEVNNDKFIVERSVNDILSFEAIGEVAAVGNSSNREYYTFDDLDSRSAGIYYYRLWSIDLNGDKKVTRIIAIKVEDDGQDDEITFKVYPIPASDHLTIEFNAPQEEKFQGYLVNNIGQNVRKLEKQILPSGITRISVDVRDLAQGQYFLNFYLGDQQEIVKILVMN